jgi:hypothetical protein
MPILHAHPDGFALLVLSLLVAGFTAGRLHAIRSRTTDSILIRHSSTVRGSTG